MVDERGWEVPSLEELGLASDPALLPPEAPTPSAGPDPGRTRAVTRLEDLPDVTCPRCGALVHSWQMRKTDGATVCLLCLEAAERAKKRRTLLFGIVAAALVLVAGITAVLFTVSARAYATSPRRSLDLFREALADKDIATARRYFDAAAVEKDLLAAVRSEDELRAMKVFLLEPSLQNLELRETHETTAVAAGSAVVAATQRALTMLEVRYVLRRSGAETSETVWVICGLENAQAVMSQLYVLAPDLTQKSAPASQLPGLFPVKAAVSTPPPSGSRGFPSANKTSPDYDPRMDPTNPNYDPDFNPFKP